VINDAGLAERQGKLSNPAVFRCQAELADRPISTSSAWRAQAPTTRPWWRPWPSRSRWSTPMTPIQAWLPVGYLPPLLWCPGDSRIVGPSTSGTWFA